MPYAAAMVKLTNALHPESIEAMFAEDDNLLAELQKPHSLVEQAQALAGLEAHEAAYIESIPAALQEAIRVAIAEAISARKPVHVLYSPAYDFSVQIWDYVAGVSVHLSGPYPPDFPRDNYKPAQP